jgi:hypothetical protein
MRGMRRRLRARKSEAAAAPAPAPPEPVPAPTIDVSAELVRVLEIVTTMCGHVIDFVETDREERRVMMEADHQERRALIEALSLVIGRIGDQPAIPTPRERVIGGSMRAGPGTPVDLRDPDNDELSATPAQPGNWSAG